jgi:hypothetical protein
MKRSEIKGEKTARGQVEADAFAHERLGAPDDRNFPRWLLRFGEEFEGRALPRGFERGEPKMCFRNAYQLAGPGSGLTYVEGFAFRSWLPVLPIHHAWCVDEDGRVVESTFEDPVPEDRYFGIRLPFSLVAEVALRTETYGVLYKEVGHLLIEEQLEARS